MGKVKEGGNCRRRRGRRSNGRLQNRFTVKVTPALLKIGADNTCPVRIFVIKKKLFANEDELDCAIAKVDGMRSSNMISVPTPVGRMLSF